MRPTDENQPGSRRPNLMSSSRRATGELNILAMLDGQAPGRRLLALPAVVRYGAAGVLACALLVALAWLVRGATPARDTGTPGAAQASAQPTQPTLAAQSTRAAPDSREAGDARDRLAVDVPSMRAAPAVDSPVSVPVPDMVASPAGPTLGAVIIDLPQPAPAMAASDVLGHAPAGAVRTPAPPRHPLMHPATPTVPSTPPRPGTRTTESRTTSSQALAHVDPAPPRQKRAAGASRATPPSTTVDTDVALISAILQHTGPRDEAADGAGTAACAGKPCGPRMPPRQ